MEEEEEEGQVMHESEWKNRDAKLLQSACMYRIVYFLN